MLGCSDASYVSAGRILFSKNSEFSISAEIRRADVRMHPRSQRATSETEIFEPDARMLGCIRGINGPRPIRHPNIKNHIVSIMIAHYGNFK